jgi:hypothetical protein
LEAAFESFWRAQFNTFSMTTCSEFKVTTPTAALCACGLKTARNASGITVTSGLRNREGFPRVLGHAMDLTERIRIERALRVVADLSREALAGCDLEWLFNRTVVVIAETLEYLRISFESAWFSVTPETVHSIELPSKPTFTNEDGRKFWL